MKNLITKIVKIAFFFITVLLFVTNSKAQKHSLEFQLGTGAWYIPNKQEEPFIEKELFTNSNFKFGYSFFPSVSVGLSTAYTYHNLYDKSVNIRLPDRYLFETWEYKNKNFGIGPYVKFGIGQNYRFSVSFEYLKTFGKISSKQQTEFVSELYYNQNLLEYQTKLLASEISLGKRVFNNLFVSIFYLTNQIFWQKYDSNYTNETIIYQNFLGVNINYYLKIN